jgi:hypothetical protein
MIIWLNGAFGAGKTQTSYELHRRIPGSFVYDPENVGYFIRKNMPQAISGGDFQDIPVWREMNFLMLQHIYREFEGTIIVPMTIVNTQYFAEIVGKLRSDGADIRHFTLCASKETIHKRLIGRGEHNSWAVQQIDRCISGLSNEVFKRHVDTENKPIEAVAETIASALNITLLPNSKGKLGKKIERWKTQIKHIRFFD